MIIVITDACFLIDLIDIDLFEKFLGLGCQVHITSSVFAELEGDDVMNEPKAPENTPPSLQQLK